MLADPPVFDHKEHLKKNEIKKIEEIKKKEQDTVKLPPLIQGSL